MPLETLIFGLIGVKIAGEIIQSIWKKADRFLFELDQYTIKVCNDRMLFMPIIVAFSEILTQQKEKFPYRYLMEFEGDWEQNGEVKRRSFWAPREKTDVSLTLEIPVFRELLEMCKNHINDTSPEGMKKIDKLYQHWGGRHQKLSLVLRTTSVDEADLNFLEIGCPNNQASLLHFFLYQLMSNPPFRDRYDLDDIKKTMSFEDYFQEYDNFYRKMVKYPIAKGLMEDPTPLYQKTFLVGVTNKKIKMKSMNLIIAMPAKKDGKYRFRFAPHYHNQEKGTKIIPHTFSANKGKCVKKITTKMLWKYNNPAMKDQIVTTTQKEFKDTCHLQAINNTAIFGKCCQCGWHSECYSLYLYQCKDCNRYICHLCLWKNDKFMETDPELDFEQDFAKFRIYPDTRYMKYCLIKYYEKDTYHSDILETINDTTIELDKVSYLTKYEEYKKESNFWTRTIDTLYDVNLIEIINPDIMNFKWKYLNTPIRTARKFLLIGYQIKIKFTTGDWFTGFVTVVPELKSTDIRIYIYFKKQKDYVYLDRSDITGFTYIIIDDPLANVRGKNADDRESIVSFYYDLRTVDLPKKYAGLKIPPFSRVNAQIIGIKGKEVIMKCKAKIPGFFFDDVIEFEFQEEFLKLPIINFYSGTETKAQSKSWVEEKMNDFSMPLTNVVDICINSKSL